MNTAYGFREMVTNQSTAQPDPNNITQSDQDIQLLQHLIEVDAVQLEPQNKLDIHETLIFKNNGAKNFSGTLRTWVPDGISELRAERRNMMDGSLEYGLQIIQNGNIISWQDQISAKSLPPLYALEYVLPAEPLGGVTKSIVYSKKLTYPTLINYKYEEKPGLPSLILKIRKPEGSSIILLDENRNNINPEDVSELEGSILYKFGSPRFKELNIEITKPAVAPAGIAGYVILGVLILLALSYPFIRKKSEKLQEIEGKIRGSFKREHEEASEEPVEETEEGIEAEHEAPPAAEADYGELAGKTRGELESEKSEILSRISELDKDYSSGNLMDEEYEELRNPYRRRLEKIDKILEKSE
ncbi:MAG: hypothetical protein OIN66_18640 [Candidatus Methanoperedens sp.]|nr:hypothetical protein [Candidatus Methanoperedens sp.]